MTTKATILAFIFAIFISSASSAALTPGNLLVARLVTSGLDSLNQVFIDEITTSGTVVQTLTPQNCMLHVALLSGLSYNQDFTAAATTCFNSTSNVFPDLTQTSMVVAIRPDGTMDYTHIGITGTSLTGALVDGRNVWAGSGTVPLIHSRRNGQNTGGSVITTQAAGASFATDIQYQRGRFYIGGLTSDPYFIATVDGGPPTSAEEPSSVSNLIDPYTFSPNIFESDDPNRFYVYSSEEIYVTSEVQGLYKLFSNDSGWYYYAVSSPIGPSYGLVVADIAGKRTAFVATSGAVYAFEDDGSQFSSPVTVKSYPSDTIGDVTFINAPAGTCDDSAKNQDESDVDCGGYSCPTCANDKACLVDEDCSSQYCNPNSACSTPSCLDLFSNQDETDVDCGGEICGQCGEGKTCILNRDCSTGYCNPSGTCSFPSCFDEVLNQDEMAIDCGGTTCPLCSDGSYCNNSTYCESGFCNKGFQMCMQPACDDYYKNQNETDVDCGGVCGPTCTAGKACLVGNDCFSLICNNLVCAAAKCNDTLRNGNETDVDCGGSCPGCQLGKNCSADEDCVSGYCENNRCQAPTCNDNVINQGETDVDCGGEVCSGCPDGKACVENDDCESDNCVDNKCAAAGNTPTRRTVVSSGNRLSFVMALLVGLFIVASSLAKLL